MKLILISFVSLLLVLTISAWRPRDPEFVAFTKARCKEYQMKDSDDEAARTKKIQMLEEFKVDDQSGCYVACVIMRTGIFSKAYESFNDLRLKRQWKRYSKYDNLGLNEKTINETADSLKALPKKDDNDCNSVSVALKSLPADNLEVIEKILFGDDEQRRKINEALGSNIKQRGVSVTQFCENRYYPENSNQRSELCDLRKYESRSGFIHARHFDCIYGLFRYHTDEYLINEEELGKDFEAIGKESSAIETALQKCLADEPTSVDEIWRSQYIHDCLVSDATVSEDYKKAFEYRDSRSVDYTLPIQTARKYDENVVKAEVEKEDAEICPQLS